MEPSPTSISTDIELARLTSWPRIILTTLLLQTTLVNFCVTEKGLEDQLLAQVVEHERPDLQEQAQDLVKQLGEFTITLKNLEDNLLTRLANSQGDILEDIELIENLEETKRTAVRP